MQNLELPPKCFNKVKRGKKRPIYLNSTGEIQSQDLHFETQSFDYVVSFDKARNYQQLNTGQSFVIKTTAIQKQKRKIVYHA